MELTSENFKKGFLVDEELMGGVSEDPDRPGQFMAFVLRHTTGESLGYQAYLRLEEAISALNGVERAWKFESSSGCGGGACGSAGGCGPGGSCAVREGQGCPAGKC